MILDNLVLENIGTFGGKNEIRLTPSSSKKPVVLIGGLNGAGKTTILEAIHLALYGPLSQARSRRSGSYDTYLRSLIHHGVPASEGAAATSYPASEIAMTADLAKLNSWTDVEFDDREKNLLDLAILVFVI
ncbi:recombination protein F [Mycobacteroides abscessus subsp. abscessus]|nr:recombination protein F [Mycobacteroides abscessus subsp. abscessus]SIA59318.1 recombination protein F [Mycobacteroides abscessus subsp. abscessus]SIA59851.1 recombination protein F [Mycobacteroides abscessus subsp. abscessus]SIA60648.1 recombination protein F [Mycobacteroides abscessus subsp. abscessus]SIA88893.1 recombination protein F [Mycobacteroides abscessus subsp. abscessus]